MTIFDFISLFGGLALFLYGMRLMWDGLKHGSSGAFKTAMEKVTNNPVVGFLLGLAVTAVIQSSTATIVITSGLVGAGIITLHQSLGLVLGALAEKNARRGLDLLSGDDTIWNHPIAIVFVILGLVSLLSPTIGAFLKKRKEKKIGQPTP